MIVEKDLLSNLKYFGLNSYEAKLWTALLSKGVSTAGELADISNVPRSRSYDVLESLENKGFVVAKIGKPIQYIALPPQEVLLRVRKKIEEEAEKKIEKIENLKTTDLVKELDLLHKQSITFLNPTELSSSIQGRENILSHLSTMIKNADHSFKCVTTPSGFERKISLINKQRNKINKNINIQIITQLNKVKENKDILMSNVNIKNNDNINSRFCLIDNKEALIMLSDDKDIHPSTDTA